MQRWGYLIVFVLFIVVGIAVVRTYQLSTGPAPQNIDTSIVIPATPTRVSVSQIQPTAPIQPTVPKATAVQPTAARPTPTPTPVPSVQSVNDASGSGATVKWVDVPSAANKVGIRQFDIITVFDGTPVDGKHYLVDLIASKKPGDIVGLTIVRGGQTLELSTQLRGSPSDNNIAYLGVRYVQEGSAPPDIK